jgi:hypothetical protein
MILTDTQRAILSAAFDHPAGLAAPPTTLPPAPRAAVAKAMLKAGLLAPAEQDEIADMALAWKLDGAQLLLAITEDGRAAMAEQATTALGESAQPAEACAAPTGAAEPATPPTAIPEALADCETLTDEDIEHELDLQQEALDAENAAAAAQAAATPRHGLRDAAQAVLTAQDAGRPLEAPLAALRAALAKPERQPRSTTPRQPRQGTKQQAVLNLLRRPEGASVVQVIEATGWQPHTVRGFFAGLKNRGLDLQVLERIRQVSPDKQGAKGSYSVYRIGEAV